MTPTQKLEAKFCFTKMAAVRHPYLGRIFEVYSEGHEIHEMFHIISEWNAGNTLGAVIEKRHKQEMLFSNDEIFHFFSFLIMAVEECHNSGFVHRNISTNHIYVSEDRQMVKLHAMQPAGMKEIKEKKYNDIYLGEYYYIGPEVYNFMPEVFDTADKPNDLFTSTADIWALGMVIFEMVKMDKKETNVHRAKY